MLRIAFIDHPYHQVTKSADFFVDLLRKRFDVRHYYAGIQTADFANDIVMGDFDIIVLWQTEYLAPFFLAEGQRVVVVPMFDGAGQSPDYYWHHMRQARVINFSKSLHDRISGLGLTSMAVQYMKDPAKYPPTADYSIPRAVFWQRLPEHGLDSTMARRLVGEEALLHVHNAPDNVPSSKYPTPEANIVSYFDLEVNALAKAMEWGNIFVCPRYAEGIGMAMLEALARGMVVIAHDSPTHSDYLTEGKTGFLADFQHLNTQPLPLDLGFSSPPTAPSAAEALYIGWSSEAQPRNAFTQIGQAARKQAIKTYEEWLLAEDSILDFIEETPQPTGIRISKANRAYLARETELWHQQARVFIERMGYWEDNGICLQDRKLQRRPEKKRMKRRQTWAFKAMRFTFRRLKSVLNRARRIKRAIWSRL